MSGLPELVARLPWVTHLDEARPCTGLMAHTPLKAVYRMGNRPPVGLGSYRCKSPAHWHFRALKRQGPYGEARDGDYCWNHLVHRGLYAGEAEIERTRRGLDRLRAADQEKANATAE